MRVSAFGVTCFQQANRYFKIENQVGISFKDHISVFPFEMSDGKTSAILTFGTEVKEFSIQFEIVENYIIVVAFEK